MWRVAPLVFRAPRGVLSGRAAGCARGRRPASLMVLLAAPLVFRAPSGPAAREIATRELRSEWSISKPARALRSLRRPPHRRCQVLMCALLVDWLSGQALRPPMGIAAWPSGPSGALHTGGAWCTDVWFGASARCLARPCGRPWVSHLGPVDQTARLFETPVAFVGAGRAATETVIAFAGAKWVFLVQFSGAVVMSVSAVPCWG